MNKTKTRYNLDNRIDYGIILPVMVLSLMGLAALFVALNHNPMIDDLWTPMLKQVLWILIGVAAVVVLMQFDSKTLWKMTPIFYAFGLALMTSLIWFHDKALAVMTGSKNWINIAGLTIQPSELMKIAFILMLAYVVTQHNSEHEHTIKNDFILIGKLVLTILPVGILLKFQQDFGTMLVYVAILGGVFLMSGITWRIVLPVIGIFLVLAAITIYLVTTDSGRDFLYAAGVKQYQLLRIDSWLDPFHDSSGKSFQQAQALVAIGSGGLLGKGFNVSEVDVPVRESDMIFTVIGENFGFIGGCLMILMYFFLIYRMIRVCFDTNNEFYAYIATGTIMMILFHVFENIGANIGLLPLTGIPLPFVSQGGSSLLGNLIGVGIILSMKFQKQDYK
ncbi:FtsW/RodA/SpoVE family cell cycle protein [Vagococcus intermedius]|uniref:FtsW/RodA/SpoVE family cell cycle protein n=1 Tax=Vagococcus intermedius TaxID=2991418 RepID=A0AAF0CU80_9ENTE|nr:FtsW/RodA/SpoVE family cell cycle protein [Vagococcus intermedius]WEG72956.1 FtsW/RodA/SpoVE family cell cycle protein [Vagococcus intermedius]WEG75042.1 FtsW/RodA/SpoVE family cell cycle protein [Vagococcus intermedius]